MSNEKGESAAVKWGLGRGALCLFSNPSNKALTGRSSPASFIRVKLGFLGAALLFVAACSTNPENAKAKRRIWGNEVIPTAVDKNAKQPIPADNLEFDADMRQRVLEMRFDEVIARLGIVKYEGTAKLTIRRKGQELKVIEESLIEQGLHGGFRVLQKDASGQPIREVVYHGGVLFLRNGPGKMRVQGIVKKQHHTVRDEAWQPLRVFTGYFGPRVGFRKIGPTESGGRAAIAYKLVLVDGPALIRNNDVDTPKKPVRIDGKIVVDAQTAVVLEATVKGKVEVPPKEEGGEAGYIDVDLQSKLQTIEGKEIKPGEYVDTIKRHPTDLDPLAFLKGEIRTSTTIGGGGDKDDDPDQATPDDDDAPPEDQ